MFWNENLSSRRVDLTELAVPYCWHFAWFHSFMKSRLWLLKAEGELYYTLWSLGLLPFLCKSKIWHLTTTSREASNRLIAIHHGFQRAFSCTSLNGGNFDQFCSVSSNVTKFPSQLWRVIITKSFYRWHKEQGNRKHERGQAYRRVSIVWKHRPFKQNVTISNTFKTQLDSDQVRPGIYKLTRNPTHGHAVITRVHTENRQGERKGLKGIFTTDSIKERL